MTKYTRKAIVSWESCGAYGNWFRVQSIADSLASLCIEPILYIPLRHWNKFKHLPYRCYPSPDHFSSTTKLIVGGGKEKYSEELEHQIFCDNLLFTKTIDSWKAILELHSPDFILGDFSPFLNNLSFYSDIPCCMVSDGYHTPPDVQHKNLILACYPELDPYGPRNGIDYVGPITKPMTVSGIKDHGWQGGVLGYLRCTTASLEIIKAYRIVGKSLYCVMPNARDIDLCSGNVTITKDFLPSDVMFRNVDYVIHNGTLGMTNLCAGEGIAQCILPYCGEHCSVIPKLQELGIGDRFIDHITINQVHIKAAKDFSINTIQSRILPTLTESIDSFIKRN